MIMDDKFDARVETYLFNNLIKEVLSNALRLWGDKTELNAEEIEDIKYLQNTFRDESKKYLKEKPYLRAIHDWIKDLSNRDKDIDWSKDRQKFFDIVHAYNHYLDQYKQIKLGSAKEDYDNIPR